MYKSQGFDFDVGVHYVGGKMDQGWSSGMRMLFDWLSDGKLEWSRLDEVYDVAYNSKTGERLEMVGDPQKNRATFLKHFPSLDPKALDSYYGKCRKARIVGYFAFVLKAFPPAVLKLVWTLGFGSIYKRYCLGTTYQVMKSCGLPDEVIGALTYSCGDYGTPPKKSPFFLQAFMENHYDGGAFFPKGGSSSIAKTFVAAIQRRGGKVFTSASVETITTTGTLLGRGHRATGIVVKGVEIRPRKCVISDAGFMKTFETIDSASTPLVNPVAASEQLALVHRNENLALFSPSFAFFYLFIGLDGTDEELRLRGQNIWHLADWNHDKVLQELFAAESIELAMEAPPPLVFLSNESAKDPDFGSRCPGKSTVTMIVWTDARWFNEYKNTIHGSRGASYMLIKERMTKTLLDILHFHFPLTKDRVVFADMGTPLSANKYLGRYCGEIYNLDHTEARFQSLNAQLALHPQTKIRNLYITGQDVIAVCVEAAALSGCFTASRVSFMALLAAIPLAFACLTWVIY